MNTIRKFFASLRVFKRIRVLEQVAYYNTDQRLLLAAHVQKLEDFINSREPCKGCGHHRYRQKTLHNGCNA